MKEGSDWSPHIALYGDFGFSNHQSLQRLMIDNDQGLYDAVFHVGKFFKCCPYQGFFLVFLGHGPNMWYWEFPVVSVLLKIRKKCMTAILQLINEYSHHLQWKLQSLKHCISDVALAANLLQHLISISIFLFNFWILLSGHTCIYHDLFSVIVYIYKTKHILQRSSWREMWEKLSPKPVPLLPFPSSGRSGFT